MNHNNHCQNHFIFPTPIQEIACENYDTIKENLIEWIYSYKENVKGIEYSNRHGWQSPDVSYDEPSFSPYVEYILSNLSICLRCYDADFKLGNLWINVNPKGAYNKFHNHPGATLSGVFWVQSPDNCGNLIFENSHYFTQDKLLLSMYPTFKENFNYNHEHSFKPKEGTLLVFPADLVHCVEENESELDRISIAFNIVPL